MNHKPATHGEGTSKAGTVCLNANTVHLVQADQIVAHALVRAAFTLV
jgi:hypothetical protein